MKKVLLTIVMSFTTVWMFAQAGHVMQGVGAVNMSMGGAATGQPLDITGAIHWNPAGISVFDQNELKFDLGLFFSSPELSSTVPIFDPNTGQPTGNFASGTTEDDRGLSPLPALAFLWGSEDSKHTFAASAFGISGFGVTFPESMTNPINAPQSMGGFGRIESDYLMMQISGTWAYELSDNFSIGVQPNFNYASIKLIPNPTANPNPFGYPSTDRASAVGFGAQMGVFYRSDAGFSAGASDKTQQSFGAFELENTYPNGATATNELELNYPAMYSVGLGYSFSDFDLALDYRYIDYENTTGFDETGWTQTAAVKGFGWESINVVSAGVQFKGVEDLPIRVGYTYSSNPIPDEIAFFNVPATAIIENAFQVGLSYVVNDALQLDAVYHYGTSNGSTEGPLLNPMLISPNNPLGAFPGSSVSYDMTTSMIMVGVSYKLGGGSADNSMD